MTQDEIIEMAVLAGLEQDGEMWFSNIYKTDMNVHISHLEAFAKMCFEKGRQQGMKQERALEKLAETSRDIGWDK